METKTIRPPHHWRPDGAAAEQVSAFTPTVERSADAPSPTCASQLPALFPRFGQETQDYPTGEYGYPPISGRMFGSGN